MRVSISRAVGLFFHVFGTGVLFFCLCSCGDTRKITYMQGKFDTAQLSRINIPEPVIRTGDLISIIVYSDNPLATAIYNQPLITVSNAASGAASGGETAGASAVGGTSPSTPGYQVDEQGNIPFQGLGLLHVEGLTKAQLKEMLNTRLTPYLKNPYFTVRFLNYKFTVLGEVNKPGVYSIPGEQLSVLQAVGLCGDLTFYGRRDNVLVIRQNGGKREFGRMDLTKPEIMASPYFYLQQNDLVIVEASKKKVSASDQVTARNVTIAASIVSTLAILYSIFKK